MTDGTETRNQTQTDEIKFLILTSVSLLHLTNGPSNFLLVVTKALCFKIIAKVFTQVHEHRVRPLFIRVIG